MVNFKKEKVKNYEKLNDIPIYCLKGIFYHENGKIKYKGALKNGVYHGKGHLISNLTFLFF